MMIFVTDAAGKATYIGPEWAVLTGQDPSQAVDFGWAAVVHPEDVDFVRTLVRDAIREQMEFTVRYRLLRQTGGFVWVAAGAIPSYGPPGRTFLGFLGSLLQLPEEDRLKACGSLGASAATAATPATTPASGLELAADHLIMAHALLVQHGGTSVLPGVETALRHIGVELAKASQIGPRTGKLH